MQGLPKLPKKLNKREADFITKKAHKWCEDNLLPPALIEFKHTRGKDYLPFSEVRGRQRYWLMRAIREKGTFYKVSDMGLGDKLVDGILVGLIDPWIIIKYPKAMAVIGADLFFEEEERSERKSLTVERAKQLSTHFVIDKR